MGDDLFTWLDALYTKTRPHGTPPVYMMHRFLAWDKERALLARYIQLDFKQEPDLAFRVWQAFLPVATRAPRMGYVAAKKAPEVMALDARMMEVLHVRREVAEAMREIVTAAGRLPELCAAFGAEQAK